MSERTDICDGLTEQGGVTSSLMPETLPSGVRLDILMEVAVDSWVVHPDYLYVSRIDLEPQAEFGTYYAYGSLTIYRLSDQLTLFAGGDPIPGDDPLATLVQDSQYYIRNDGPEPGSVLLIEVTPEYNPNRIQRSSPWVTAGEDSEAPAGQVVPMPAPGSVNTLVLSAKLPPVLPAPARLFIGCLTWDQASIDLGRLEMGGVIGLRVLQGELEVEGMAGSLGVGQCLPLGQATVHRIVGGEEPPVVLVFGVVPDGQPVWQAAAAEVSPPWDADYQCVEPVDS